MNQQEHDVNPDELAGHTSVAENELTAFMAAVDQLWGAEEARRSAEDWIEQLELRDCPGEKSVPDFRKLSIDAAAKMARRINHHNHTKGEHGDRDHSGSTQEIAENHVT